MSKLIIVESPAKASTINKYLGGGFKVASCGGHIRDLSKKKSSKNSLGVDIDNQFKPYYQIIPNKKTIVANLKKMAQDSHEVILASDDDREGEAIAWHLCQALGLDQKTTKRIVFNEITKPAIEAALADPRPIDQALVNAQQARRILDRIVGFELSPVLWRTVQTKLSAGRVQSVAVRLILEKEQTITDFVPRSFFQVDALFRIGKTEVNGGLNKRFNDLTEAKDFLLGCQGAEFSVADIDARQGKKKPPVPFKTSSLQQTASTRLRFSPRQTMRLAQKLYEAGFITYMRTDSLNLSQQFLQSTKNYISQTFGAQYSTLRTYQTKAQGAQEAHEAIRPTKIELAKVTVEEEAAQRLYNLIRSQSLASQMAAAETTKTTISIQISQRPEKFQLKGEVLVFDGFLKVYPANVDDVILPELKVGQSLDPIQIIAKQKLTSPPKRYSEASLIGQLEDLGIGRPSTYAPTISTIIKRGYVVRGDVEPSLHPTQDLILQNGQIKLFDSEQALGASRNRLLSTPLAKLVNNFLMNHFASIVDYNFTKNVEAQLDQIAKGKLEWTTQLDNFYQDFHPLIEKSRQMSREDVNPMRTVGQDPADGRTIYARLGRFGPMLQKGHRDDVDQKPQFAPLPKGADLTTVTLEMALKAFQLPRKVGQDDQGVDICAKNGPFGPYLEVGSQRISLKDKDPLTINLDQAQQVIADFIKENKAKILLDLGKIKILKGPYGPYLTDGNKNRRLPKDCDPAKVSLDQAREILAQPAPKKGRFRPKKNS